MVSLLPLGSAKLCVYKVQTKGGTAPRAQLKTGRTDASSRTKSTKRAPSPEADEAEKGNKRPKTNGSKDTTAKPVAEKSSANATTVNSKPRRLYWFHS